MIRCFGKAENMKKITYLLVILSLVCGLLLSCAPSDDGGGDNSGNSGTGGGNTPPANEENILWSDTLAPTIIVGDQDIFGFENQLATHIFDISGNIPEVRASVGDGVVREISLGETGSSLSKKAYVRLDDTFNLSLLDDNGDSAWIILSSGGNIAVAYTDTFAKKAAVEYIIKNCTDMTYAPKNGVVAKESFNTEEYLIGIREEFKAPMFDAVAKELGEGAAAMLKKLYALYDEDLYLWMVNLYCPDIGGFYYSNSARDNEGFLPDLESTGQVLGTLERTGLTTAYGGSWTKLLPYEVSENILAFAKGLQVESGWFYHPQWGEGISDTRRGRDSGWAKTIISDMKSMPNYTYATQQIEGVSSISPLTVKLGSGMPMAVSRVVATASDDSKYATTESFIAYLDSLNFAKNSYSAGNVINSTSGQIKAHGHWDTLKAYLIEHQNPNNGLWESDVTYQSVNGLMKLCTVFGSSYPNAEKAMDSAITILKRPIDDELEGITYVYNPWVAISNLLHAVSEDKAKELRAMLHEEAEDIFKMTFEKLGAFVKPDGGFSYGREYSSPFSQEALVAVSGSVESDVNATSIAVSTVVTYMKQVYGIAFPTMFCPYDAVYFLDNLAEMDTIIKNRVEDPVIDTFDEFLESDGQIQGNVVMRPGEYITNNVGDGDGLGEGYKWFESAIVPNPAPGADPKDMVLYVADKTYPDAPEGEKQIADAASSTEFRISNFSVPGNCYVFEADMMFNRTTETGSPLAQLTFVREGSALISSWVDFYQYKRFGQNYIRIQDYSNSFAGADGIRETELASGIPVDDWFKLRVELYKDYSGEGGKLTIYLKIYINGTLVSVSDTGHYESANESYKDFLVSAIRLSYYRHTASSLYLNNVFVGKTGAVYVPEKGGLEPDSEIADGKHIYDFEGGIINNNENFTEMFYNDEDLGMTSINAAFWNAALDEQYIKSGGAKITSVADPRNASNKVIKAYSYNTKTSAYKATMYVDDTQLAAGGKTYEIEFDYYFERIAWLFAGDFFSVNLQNDAGASLASVTFTSTDFADNYNTATSLGIRVGNSLVDGVRIKYDRWYSFKMVYYYDPDAPEASRMVIYVLHEGEYVCISNDILPCKVDTPSRVGLTFHCYDIRGTQYIDDLVVSRTDAEYEHIVPAPGIMYEIPIEGDNNAYVTESSRGEGVYCENAISYTGTSYQKLISGGYMAKNTARGDGTELTDKITKIIRKISVEKVNGDDAFVYSSLGSGNTAVNFISRAPAYDGFVFETDVKLSGVDSFPGRDIRFTGTTTNGTSDSGLWAFNVKFSINFNEDVGGYLITVANGDKAIGIPDDTWVNIRLEAKGLEKGSALILYVNGAEMITTTLNDSIKGIKGVELFTPSTYSGHGWEKGSISIDNTYLSGTGTAPNTYEITDSSHGEGENLGNAITYEGKTYAGLVSEGLMASNTKRGDGLSAGKRALYVDTELEGLSYLYYSSLGSGNHAINFVSQKNAYDGFVFETDIRLRAIDSSEPRALSFTGSTTNGTDDAKLYAYKLYMFVNPDLEGTYVIMVANSKERVIVKDDSWVNIRLVASGLEKDSPLELFVNGESTIKTTLNNSISGIKGVELYTPSTYNGSQGWEGGEIHLDNTYVSGTGMKPGFPVVSGSSRGEGANLGSAISYDGVTYEEIIASGKMVKNTARGDGVEAGNRTISLVDIDGNKALAYTAIGSGNHSLNFALDKEVGTGLIFETDIMLDGINTSEQRSITFMGTTTNGTANADCWSFTLKLCANPDTEQGGYFLTLGGSSYHAVIPDKTWVNIRIEVNGYRLSEEFYVYINGERVATGYLSGSISNVKGIELYTQSTYNGLQGLTEGTIYLDNTYATGTGEKPATPSTPTIPPEGSETPESGNSGNMDGDGWDN